LSGENILISNIPLSIVPSSSLTFTLSGNLLYYIDKRIGYFGQSACLYGWTSSLCDFLSLSYDYSSLDSNLQLIISPLDGAEIDKNLNKLFLKSV
jgi:hypothetical protein